MHRFTHYLCAIVCALLIAGCSNVKPYQASGKGKLLINSKTDSNVTAEVDIYHIGKACQLDYRGTLEAENGKMETRLTASQSTYLVVRFSSSSFLSGSHSMSQELLFKPSSKRRYYLDLSYIDSIYNVELKDSKLNSRKFRQTTQLDWDSCK